MKLISIINLFLLTLCISPYGFGQAIDASILDSLSADQIELAKSQLAKNKTIAMDEAKPVTESTKKLESIINTDGFKDKKYGYNYFLSVPSTISAVGDLPLPNDYRISLNDQFSVILSGSKESIFNLNVNLDGTILFPELGSISVVGETFQDIKNKLKLIDYLKKNMIYIYLTE